MYLVQLLFQKSDSVWWYRGALVGFAIVSMGLGFDMRWHGVYPVRDHYFIAPHVVIYFGICVVLASCMMLRLRGVYIPLHVFALFPLLSLFDEWWHRIYGIELASSPMMFWSPAHWSFGLVTLYVFFLVYRTGVEKNATVLLYVRTMIYSVLPLKFFWYMLVPLAPYSRYVELQSPVLVVVPVLVFLSYITAYKVHQSSDIALLSVALLAPTGAGRLFLLPTDTIYNASAIYTVPLFILFCMIVSRWVSESAYVVVGVSTIVWMALLLYLSTATVYSWDRMVYALVLGGCAGGMYFNVEKYIVRYIRSRISYIDNKLA